MSRWKKILKYGVNNPEYNFIGLCIDSNQNNWIKTIENFNNDAEYLVLNKKNALENLLILSIHKVYILNTNGEILNTELNIFDSNFEKQLKNITY